MSVGPVPLESLRPFVVLGAFGAPPRFFFGGGGGGGRGRGLAGSPFFKGLEPPDIQGAVVREGFGHRLF
jgi:hypothetical protein